MAENQEFWRKCSSCKNPIFYSSKYHVCSVSTCNSKRQGYIFCSVPCFERHLPGARHRDAAAVEMMSPSKIADSSSTPQRRIVRSGGTDSKVNGQAKEDEVLVIASRLKEFIHRKSDFNTSGSVMTALSDHLRVVCERAIDNARADGRKTVMDRDFGFLKK